MCTLYTVHIQLLTKVNRGKETYTITPRLTNTSIWRSWNDFNKILYASNIGAKNCQPYKFRSLISIHLQLLSRSVRITCYVQFTGVIVFFYLNFYNRVTI